MVVLPRLENNPIILHMTRERKWVHAFTKDIRVKGVQTISDIHYATHTFVIPINENEKKYKPISFRHILIKYVLLTSIFLLISYFMQINSYLQSNKVK